MNQRVLILSVACLISACSQLCVAQQATSAGAAQSVLLTAAPTADSSTELVAADLRISGVREITSLEKLGDTSLSIAFVVDESNSEREVYANQQKSVIQTMQSLVRAEKDHAIYVGFNSTPHLRSDWTTSIDKLTDAAKVGEPGGGSAFYDGMVLAVRKMAKTAPANLPRVIFAYSDGEDNQSKFSRTQLLGELLSAGVRVYLFTEFGSDKPGPRAEQVLDSIAKATGGRVYRIPSGKHADDQQQQTSERLSKQLRSWYRVTFVPLQSSSAQSEKLTIKLNRGGFDLLAPDAFVVGHQPDIVPSK